MMLIFWHNNRKGNWYHLTFIVRVHCNKGVYLILARDAWHAVPTCWPPIAVYCASDCCQAYTIVLVLIYFGWIQAPLYSSQHLDLLVIDSKHQRQNLDYQKWRYWLNVYYRIVDKLINQNQSTIYLQHILIDWWIRMNKQQLFNHPKQWLDQLGLS